MTAPAVADRPLQNVPLSRQRSSTLSVVIPAHNEGSVSAALIEQTLAASDSICADAGLSGVEVVIVGNGATQRLAEIAARRSDIKLIAGEQNLDYGSAIRRGVASASGDLLAVLNVDTETDPRFLGPLCRILSGYQADIAVAALPEGASAMRVMRRATAHRLHILPDDVDFMAPVSRIAILEPGLTVVQVPLGYEERVRESQLNVVPDGVRSLRGSSLPALSHRPLRVLGTAGVALLLFALGYGLYPAVHYLRERRIEEVMFYRLSVVAFAITTGWTLVLAGLLAQHADAIHDARYGSLRRLVDRVLSVHLPLCGLFCLAAAGGLNAPALRYYLTSGQIGPYWSHVLAAGMFGVLGVQFISFSVLARAMRGRRHKRPVASWPDEAEQLH